MLEGQEEDKEFQKVQQPAVEIADFRAKGDEEKITGMDELHRSPPATVS